MRTEMISPLLQQLLQRSRDGCLLLLEQRIVLANQAFLDLCGCSLADLAGREAHSVVDALPAPGERRKLALRTPDSTLPVEGECLTEDSLLLLIVQDPARPDSAQLAERLQAILDISRRMAGAVDMNELMQQITRACHHLVEANNTTIYGLHPEGDRLVPLYTDDPHYADLTMNFEIPVGTGLTGHVVQTGRAAIVNDPATSGIVVQVPGTPDEIDEVLMSVPLMTGERALGAVTITRPITRPFSTGDLEIISILAGQASALLAQAELVRLIAESERQFRSLVENADIGLFRMTAEGALIGVNPYICRVLGLASGVDVSPRRVWGSEREHLAFLERLNSEGSVTDAPVTTMRSDGRLVELLISARRVPGQREIEGSLRDDTERRRLALESVARLGFLDNLLAQLQLGMVILDPGGQVRQHNPAFARLTGGDDRTGEEHAFLRLRRQMPEVEALWQRALRREAARVEELAMPPDCCGDGGLRHISVATVPVSNQSGVLTDVVFLLEDVSERRALRTQLIQSQKMDSVGSLAGGLAHGFNNILAGILGNTGHLRRLTGEMAGACGPLDTIERAVGSAAQLTRQLLGFARLGEESMEAQDINTTLGHCLDLFRRGLKPDVRLEEELGSGLSSVKADTVQVEQAVLNLLLNAADAIGEQGTITLRSRLRAAEAGSTDRAAWVEVEVQDTGCGIPEVLLPKIFDPFFTTKEKGQGSGLGLAMVFTIMERHGGRAEIQSRVGYGTRVRLLFPVAAVRESSSAAAPQDTTQVWIADDDTVMRDMLRRILESQHYQVRAFDGGPAMLEALREEPGAPDLFVLDVLMPGMNGLELCHELAGLRPDLRVILCSGYTQCQRGELLELPGVRGFIAKPFTISSMGSLVRQALN